MSNVYTPTHLKIFQRDDLVPLIQQRQQAGEQGVFTNGCFDLLHLGHIRYLQEARALGDFLIMGLNSDDSVQALKGPTRPLVSEQERAEIIAALACIDYVVIFPELTADVLLENLQPAIYVKGGDYTGAQSGIPDTDRLPEAKTVYAYGGAVHLIPYLPHHSTTELIAKIKLLPDRS